LSWPSTSNTNRPLSKKTPRRLFLDDDPERASAFLEQHPDAVWVQTVAECVEKLAEAWDEIHLDHDLGGEHYVTVDREDCGMEVVRWLVKEPRKHLRRARFTIHSHNIAAAFEMVMRLQGLGYRVEARPFGVELPEVEAEPTTGLGRLKRRARALIRRLRGLEPRPEAGPVDDDSPDEFP
jgi:Cyclic-phosphate processing Receiver domain